MSLMPQNQIDPVSHPVLGFFAPTCQLIFEVGHLVTWSPGLPVSGTRAEVHFSFGNSQSSSWFEPTVSQKPSLFLKFLKPTKHERYERDSFCLEAQAKPDIFSPALVFSFYPAFPSDSFQFYLGLGGSSTLSGPRKACHRGNGQNRHYHATAHRLRLEMIVSDVSWSIAIFCVSFGSSNLELEPIFIAIKLHFQGKSKTFFLPRKRIIPKIGSELWWCKTQNKKTSLELKVFHHPSILGWWIPQAGKYQNDVSNLLRLTETFTFSRRFFTRCWWPSRRHHSWPAPGWSLVPPWPSPAGRQ